MLEREGFVINHERAHRLYPRVGLAVRRRGKRERVAVERSRQRLTLLGRCWPMDFEFGDLANCRLFKCFTVVKSSEFETAVAR